MKWHNQLWVNFLCFLFDHKEYVQHTKEDTYGMAHFYCPRCWDWKLQKVIKLKKCYLCKDLFKEKDGVYINDGYTENKKVFYCQDCVGK